MLRDFPTSYPTRESICNKISELNGYEGHVSNRLYGKTAVLSLHDRSMVLKIYGGVLDICFRGLALMLASKIFYEHRYQVVMITVQPF